MLFSAAALLPLAVGFIAGGASAARLNSKNKEVQIVKGSYIVELEDDHDVNTFYNTLTTSSIKAKPRMDLTYSLFKGASFTLEGASESKHQALADQIAGLGPVKKIWPVRLFPLPDDEVIATGDAAIEMNDAIQKRDIGGLGLNKRQSNGSTDSFSPHVMTQVDRLRAEGVTGTGLKIAVVDTGIDYFHPALGGGFGPGHLVSYGTDLVGDNYTGSNTPVPDPDPIDTCEGHGSHVAGIIAAQANQYGFTGAAPGVTLGAYRVFGCGGSAGNDVLIAAYMQAYEDGSDIITASIGGPSGWSEDPWAVAVQRIVEKGVPCTVSAGNEGSDGQFYASTAANGKGVAAIASVDNANAPSYLVNATYSVGGNGSNSSTSASDFGWTPGEPSNWGNITLPLWAVNYNTTDTANGCNPYPADTPDLSGYIVLIRRGTCTYVQKVTNAAQKGAKYILFYNNAAGTVSVSAPVAGVEGVGMVDAPTGVNFINLLAAGNQVTVTIQDPRYAPRYLSDPKNTYTGGFLSTYTTWGPTWELDVKPQISTPGGIIFSTYPRALGAYAVLSGTSMACPLAAAIYALVAQVRKTKDPATLENVIASTANPNLFHNGQRAFPYLAPVSQQGAGLAQAYDAAHTTSVLSVSSLAYNDTEFFQPTKNFTISNTGTSDVTFSLSNIGAATAYSLQAGTIYTELFPNTLTTNYATLAFSSDKVTIAAGSQSVISVTVTPPQGLDASRLPVYSGYIALNSTDGQSLSLPYQGVVGRMRNATVLETAYLTTTSDPNLNPVPANQTFILPSPGTNGTSNTTYPAILVSLVLGSAYTSVDVIPVWSSSNSSSIGQIFGTPFEWQTRSFFAQGWDGELADGTYAPAGSYKLLVKSLRIFGDRSKATDYDGAYSVPFTIKYSA